MGKYGINVPKGVAVSSVEEVRKAIETTFPNEKELVVKCQILAGGRGLGKFTSGLQGGVHIVKIDQVEEIAVFSVDFTPRSILKCGICKKVYSGNENHLDLTVTSGSKKYGEYMPASSEILRLPLVSFL
ncbi:ATP-citrate lyase/succinyl-CoA ligase [Artemisia annua]|uniref:ATP-citrate lyase/succinyl-CoA ligase n=1 Tax=Artemisia annua TaxID=35608 RepID=A0A2U1Q9T8_ARTAN|nr:ATP-citrate lyase/succinyl-CoA ligase [Artemisia annua]